MDNDDRDGRDDGIDRDWDRFLDPKGILSLIHI